MKVRNVWKNLTQLVNFQNVLKEKQTKTKRRETRILPIYSEKHVEKGMTEAGRRGWRVEEENGGWKFSLKDIFREGMMEDGDLHWKIYLKKGWWRMKEDDGGWEFTMKDIFGEDIKGLLRRNGGGWRKLEIYNERYIWRQNTGGWRSILNRIFSGG